MYGQPFGQPNPYGAPSGGYNAAQLAQSSTYGGTPSQQSFIPSYAAGASQVNAASLASASAGAARYGGTPVNAASMAMGSLSTGMPGNNYSAANVAMGGGVQQRNPYMNGGGYGAPAMSNPYANNTMGNSVMPMPTAAQYGTNAFVRRV